MAHSPVLEVRSVSKAYRGRRVVAEASLELWPERITCLLGPSGCGKTSLLRLIAGLEAPDSGEIEAGGRLLAGRGTLVPPERRGIGLVFQDFALFPHLTAAQNVGFGLRHLPAPMRRDRAAALLEQFRLGHLADAWPQTLSGGEQQRVAIARALAREPMAVLLDEPFSGLDGDLKAEVRHAVLEGLRKAGTTALVVTHDPEEAMLIADRLVLMGEGRILQTGSPRECYYRPSSIRAARLLGEVNVIDASVANETASTAFGPMPAEGLPDGRAILMVRPEGLRPDSAGAEMKVVRIRFGGGYHEVTLEAEGRPLTMTLTDDPPAMGTIVRVSIDARRSAWLEGGG
ncbi:MAG: ABC transporter ATP-binding protein [Allosphingosinicella sp.]